MAPTLPFLTPSASSDDKPIILSDDEAFSDDKTIIILSDDDQVHDESSEYESSEDDEGLVDDSHFAPVVNGVATSSKKERGPYSTWNHHDEIKLFKTIANLRKANSGLEPSASAVLAALQQGSSPLHRQGKLDARIVYQKIRQLKNKFKKACAHIWRSEHSEE